MEQDKPFTFISKATHMFAWEPGWKKCPGCGGPYMGTPCHAPALTENEVQRIADAVMARLRKESHGEND